MDPITLAFLVAGVVLIGSELFHLSLVPVFIGAAALATAALRGTGAIDSLSASLIVWSVLSLGLAVPLRPMLRRMLPGGKGKFDPADEDKDAAGTIVEVLDVVDEESSKGRIRYQGTSWAAQSTEGVLPKGSRAKLVGRKKLVWFVEPLSPLEGVDEPAQLGSGSADAVPALDGSKTSSTIGKKES